MRRVFWEQGDDARAMFFAALVCNWVFPTRTELREPAKLGYAPAQAWLAHICDPRESCRFEWAEKAAAQDDPDGIFELAFCFWFGVGCEKDESKGVEGFREAAAMEHVAGHWWFASCAFEEPDWRRYHWLKRAAVLGSTEAIQDLISAASKHLELLGENGSNRHVFEIGADCREHVQAKDGSAFGSKVAAEQVSTLERVVSLHEKWCEDARQAIRCWIWVGLHRTVSKDMRNAISKMLWANKWTWSQKTSQIE